MKIKLPIGRLKNTKSGKQSALAVIVALIVVGTMPWWLIELINEVSANTYQQNDYLSNGAIADNPQSTIIYSDIVGATYEVECTDERYGNIFSAFIKFPNKQSGKWRYGNSTGWNETLYVEYLSAHRVLLTLGENDPTYTTWDLEFTKGFRDVKGTYKFLQKNPTRWRGYVVVGKRLE